MGGASCYQVKILSKQINKVRSYNSLAVNPAYSEVGMNPLFLTGFSDGEACFLVNIYKSSKHKTGWGARATFEIGLDLKDLPILNRIKSYLGVGNVTSRTNGSCVYSVQSIKDLDVLIEHFDKYPLITKKGVDYLLFKKAVNLIKNKEHLTMKGLRKIVSIRASMNWGLPKTIEAAFTNIIKFPRPIVLDCKIKDPNWLAGFTSGEGFFW
jgi:sRNA-binding regulator protein Hfq